MWCCGKGQQAWTPLHQDTVKEDMDLMYTDSQAVYKATTWSKEKRTFKTTIYPNFWVCPKQGGVPCWVQTQKDSLFSSAGVEKRFPFKCRLTSLKKWRSVWMARTSLGKGSCVDGFMHGSPAELSALREVGWPPSLLSASCGGTEPVVKRESPFPSCT